MAKNLQANKQAKKELKKLKNHENFRSFQYFNTRSENNKFEK